MPTDQPAQLTPAQRPYVTPALVVHGDVQTLTLGKTGPNPDLDSAGSFIPDGGS